jgi:HSP20 family protein
MAAFGLFDRFDPFAEMARLQREVNDLFSARGWHWGLGRAGAEFPPVNISKDDEAYCIQAEVPGMKSEDLELSVTADTLTLKGERKADAEAKDTAYHRRERAFGAFTRVLQLPDRVDADKAEATYKNGLLVLRIPRKPEAQPKRITIGGAEAKEGTQA